MASTCIYKPSKEPRLWPVAAVSTAACRKRLLNMSSEPATTTRASLRACSQQRLTTLMSLTLQGVHEEVCTFIPCFEAPGRPKQTGHGSKCSKCGPSGA